MLGFGSLVMIGRQIAVQKLAFFDKINREEMLRHPCGILGSGYRGPGNQGCRVTMARPRKDSKANPSVMSASDYLKEARVNNGSGHSFSLQPLLVAPYGG